MTAAEDLGGSFMLRGIMDLFELPDDVSARNKVLETVLNGRTLYPPD